MKLRIASPTRAYIEDATEEEKSSLASQLTYTNTSKQHQLKRLVHNHWFRNKNKEAWETAYEDLKKSVKQTLLFQDGDKSYIRPGSIPYLQNLKLEIVNEIRYPEPKKVAWNKLLPFDLHPYQQLSVDNLIAQRHGNVELCTGCHAKGTKILMFDGTLRNVEDIVVGDKLMGPDSTERVVLELHKGIDEMYEISPIKGDPFVVNSGHILSLQRTNTGKTYLRKDGSRYGQEDGPNPIINVSVKEYLSWSKNKKHVYKLYRSGVIFNNINKLEIPPYILGLWLGDGASSRCSLTTMDKEIEQEWCSYISSLGLKITIDHKINNKAKSYNGTMSEYIRLGRGNRAIQNAFNIILNKYSLCNNKHIPIEYLTSSVEERKQLLAGLIDTDGHYHHGYYEIMQKNKSLANDILYLARSLGLQATSRLKKSKTQNGIEGEYVRINITGDLSDIPVRLDRKKSSVRKQIKNTLRTGFSIKHIGKGDYYGFSLNKDKLYLMGDFTVTHNSGKSAILLKICRETGFRTAIIAPSESIFNELVNKFEYHLGKSQVGTFGDGRKKIDKRFTICIGDSLSNVKPDTEEWEFFSKLDMICVDESHTWAADTLETLCHDIFADVPVRMFFSGTQTRNDGAEKLLQSIINKTVCVLTTQEAVSGGYIADHDYRIVKIESSNPNFQSADILAMKREHFLRNRNIAAFIAKLANSTAETSGKQTLVLVEELGQISMLIKHLKVPYAYAHSEKKKQKLEELGLEKVDRADSVEKFNKNQVKVLIGTSCIATGTNIYPTHNCINWVGGSSEIKTKQGAVGRAVRLHSHNPWADKCIVKDKSTIYDFDVYDCYPMQAHLEDRISYYKDSGTEIKYINLRK